MNQYVILSDDGQKLVLVVDENNVLVEIRPMTDEELAELDNKS